MAGTVSEVLRQFLPNYLRGNPALNSDQRRAIWAIEHCRTLALGGEVYACHHCPEHHFAWHSCNHKACPLCGREATANWVRRQMDKRVNAPYFMVNFTLPAELRPFFMGPTAREAFDAFFSVSSQALSLMLSDSKWLGASTNGSIGILHTWNQRLLFHPHLHFIVPGAGLDHQGKLVRVSSAKFLIHIGELRGAFMRLWRRRLKELKWDIDPQVWSKEWGVYIKPFGSGDNVIKYLGAYVCRTAIGDRRILSVDQDSVTFSWKDRSDGNRTKIRTIPGVEFVHRYLRHVLPRGLRSVRYFGFCHPAAKRKYQQIQLALGSPPGRKADSKNEAEPRKEGYLCPKCGAPMHRTHSIGRDGRSLRYPQRGPPRVNLPAQEAAA